jgi:hypothetical protein
MSFEVNRTSLTKLSRAEVYSTAALNMPTSAVWEQFDWNTVFEDTDGLYDGGDPELLTIPTAGLWQVIYQFSADTDATGDRAARVLLNGSTTFTPGGTSGIILYGQVEAADVGPTTITLCRNFRFSSGDTIEAWGLQSSGGALTIERDATFFSVTKIGT